MDHRLDNLNNPSKLTWRQMKKKDEKDEKLKTLDTVKLDPHRIKKDPKMLDAVPHFYHPSWKDCKEQCGAVYSNVEGEEFEFRGVPSPGNPSKLIETEKIFGNLQIIDTKFGANVMETSSVPIFILCPRIFIDNQKISGHADVKCLDEILQKYSKKVSNRGESRTGFSEQFASVGAHARRGGPGISVTDVNKFKCCKESFAHLRKMLNRIEFFAKSVLPFGLLSTIKAVRELVHDETSLTSPTGGKDGIWASVAASYNYMSPAHTDNDAFLTALTVSFVPHAIRHRKYFYVGKDLPVAVYMCFPTEGIAVALRPGDVIFFNPQYHHCVSGRCDHYIDEKIHLSSFYMKTMQLGLNDNSIALDNVEIEEKVAEKIPEIDNVNAIRFKKRWVLRKLTDVSSTKIPNEISIPSVVPVSGMWSREKTLIEQTNLRIRKRDRKQELDNLPLRKDEEEKALREKIKMLDKHERFEK
jgi:hypothetical protein